MSEAVMLKNIGNDSVVTSGTFVAKETGYAYSFDVGKTADEYDYILIQNMTHILGEDTSPVNKLWTRFVDFINGNGWGGSTSSNLTGVAIFSQTNITAARWSVTRSGTTVSFNGYANAPEVKEGETYRWMIWKEQRRTA